MTWRGKLGYSLIAIGLLFACGAPLLSHLLTPRLTDEQQHRLNTLTNTLYDFDHPTPENVEIRKIECIEFMRKAEEYSRLPVSGIDKKVFSYKFNCEPKFGKARPPDGGN